MKKLFLIGCLTLTVACQSASATSQAESTPIAATHATRPPEPATATLTFTPAPTASATSTPVPLFFTEEFNADMSAWVSFQTGGETNPTVTLENDMLRLDFSSPQTWYYAIQTSHEYQNVSISAKFTAHHQAPWA